MYYIVAWWGVFEKTTRPCIDSSTYPPDNILTILKNITPSYLLVWCLSMMSCKSAWFLLRMTWCHFKSSSLTPRGLDISDSPAPRLIWTCKEIKGKCKWLYFGRLFKSKMTSKSNIYVSAIIQFIFLKALIVILIVTKDPNREIFSFQNEQKNLFFRQG